MILDEEDYYFHLKRFWGSPEIINRPKKVELNTNAPLMDQQLLVNHSQSDFNYEFTPKEKVNSTESPEEKQNPYAEWGKQYAKDKSWEITKDLIGAGLISVGSWLAAPDPVLGPVDEIVGVILIWTGRIVIKI